MLHIIVILYVYLPNFKKWTQPLYALRFRRIGNMYIIGRKSIPSAFQFYNYIVILHKNRFVIVKNENIDTFLICYDKSLRSRDEIHEIRRHYEISQITSIIHHNDSFFVMRHTLEKSIFKVSLKQKVNFLFPFL